MATTTWQHGYRVTGYCLNYDNQVLEHVCENYTNTKKPAQVKATLTKLFTSPQTGRLMSKALFNQLLSRLMALLDLIEKNSVARIVGSSLFFVCARDYYEVETDSIKVV